MKSTRAKFKCTSVEKTEGWNGNAFHYTAKFQAVTSDSEENKQFFAATPNGSISLSTLKEDFFEVGKEYFVDFGLAASQA